MYLGLPSLRLSPSGSLDNAIRALFASGEKGAVYDVSVLSSMYQDSTGVTAAAINSPVGLVLDGKYGYARGSEIVVNGGFDADTNWAKGLGWTIAAGVAAKVGGGATSLTTAAGPLTVGKTYEVTFDMIAATGTVNVVMGTSFYNASAALGAKRIVGLCTVNGNLAFQTGTDCTIDNVSIKEIPGAHKLQATSASRPTLKQDANGKLHLEYDGFDDSMATASTVDFSATDKMFVCAGVHKASDAARGMVMELSAISATNNGVFFIDVANTVGADSVFAAKGTVSNQIQKTGLASPISFVAAGTADISTGIISQRINGVATSAGSAGALGTGNFGNYIIYFGRRGGLSLPLLGREYPSVIRGALTSSAQIAMAERWVNSKTGAY